MNIFIIQFFSEDSRSSTGFTLASLNVRARRPDLRKRSDVSHSARVSNYIYIYIYPNPNMEIPVGALGPLDSKIVLVVSRLTVRKHFEVEVRFDFVQSDLCLLAMELFCPVSS